MTIRITREGTTPGQKAALIKGATDLLRDVLGKPPSLTFVVIQEVDMDDWGVDGLPAAEHRRRAAAGSTGQASERPPNKGRRPWPSVDVRKDAPGRDEIAAVSP